MMPFKSRSIDSNRTVSVYRNLKGKPGDWSIRQGSLVVAHGDFLVLQDCTAHINEAGRQRAIREGQRNVHAYIRGDLIVGKKPDEIDLSHLTPIHYFIDGENSGFRVSPHNGLLQTAGILVFMDRHLWMMS